MAQLSPIEWTDATWNPITGCTKIGPGCDTCYAVSRRGALPNAGAASPITPTSRALTCGYGPHAPAAAPAVEEAPHDLCELHERSLS